MCVTISFTEKYTGNESIKRIRKVEKRIAPLLVAKTVKEVVDSLLNIFSFIITVKDLSTPSSEEKKLDMVLKKLDEISESIIDLKYFVGSHITCSHLEQSYKNDLNKNIKYLLKKINYFIQGNINIDLKKSTEEICFDKLTGISKILSSIDLYLEEKEVYIALKDCCRYDGKCIENWTKQVKELSFLFVYLVNGCEMISEVKTNFNKFRFVEEIQNKIDYYTQTFLFKEFIEDTDKLGLRSVVKSIDKKHSKAELTQNAVEIAKELKLNYSYFDWDVIKFPYKGYYDYHYDAGQNDHYCGSIIFDSDDDKKLLVSWCKADQVTKYYNKFLSRNFNPLRTMLVENGQKNVYACLYKCSYMIWDNPSPKYETEIIKTSVAQNYNYILCIFNKQNYKYELGSSGKFMHFKRINGDSCFFSGALHINKTKNIKLSDEIIFRTSLSFNMSEVLNEMKLKSEKLRLQNEKAEISQVNYKLNVVKWLQSTRITNWGEWGEIQYCQNGYANGFRIKVEADNENDNSALNELQLYCPNFQIIESKLGLKGDWSHELFCSNSSKVNGFRLKVQRPLESLDDTAANSIELSCSDGKILKANNGGENGEWDIWRYCPNGTFVCGIRTQIEYEVFLN